MFQNILPCFPQSFPDALMSNNLEVSMEKKKEKQQNPDMSQKIKEETFYDKFIKMPFSKRKVGQVFVRLSSKG
jgi:hypothetical protein